MIGQEIIQNKHIREEILSLEETIKKSEGAFLGDSEICPLKHSFSDQIYVREIFIPAGTILTGKIHKHQHPNFLMSGAVDVVTEKGIETLIGPCVMISDAGTKRAVHTISDCHWVTVHHNPTNTQDLEELEKLIIAPSYDEYEKFKNKKLPFYKRILNLIK